MSLDVENELPHSRVGFILRRSKMEVVAGAGPHVNVCKISKQFIKNEILSMKCIGILNVIRKQPDFHVLASDCDWLENGDLGKTLPKSKN